MAADRWADAWVMRCVRRPQKKMRLASGPPVLRGRRPARTAARFVALPQTEIPNDTYLSEIRNESDEASAASTCNFGVRRRDLTGLPSAAPRDSPPHVATGHNGHAQRQDICRGSERASRL